MFVRMVRVSCGVLTKHMPCTIYIHHEYPHDSLLHEIESSNKTTSVCLIKVLGCNLGAIQAVVCYFSLVFSSSSSLAMVSMFAFLYVNCVRYFGIRCSNVCVSICILNEFSMLFIYLSIYPSIHLSIPFTLDHRPNQHTKCMCWLSNVCKNLFRFFFSFENSH